MNGIFARTALLGAVALLSGCASTSGGGGGGASAAVDVTRFHLGQQIARGQIAVEAAEPGQAAAPDFGRVIAAVETQLSAQGWQVVRGNTRSEQVALVRMTQGSRAQLASRPSVVVGVGGGSGGFGGGVGGGIGLTVPIGGGRGAVVVTELGVRLQRRSDGTAIWEGRAQSEARAGTPLAMPGNAADRLAPALFAGFPGESGRTIRTQ